MSSGEEPPGLQPVEEGLIIAAGALLAGVVLVFVLTALFCRYYRWNDGVVERWGQPNHLRDPCCYCYPELWVHFFPSCVHTCKDRLPQDRSVPFRAPAAHMMTGASTEVIPEVANNPPPTYQQAEPERGAEDKYKPPKDEPPSYVATQ